MLYINKYGFHGASKVGIGIMLNINVIHVKAAMSILYIIFKYVPETYKPIFLCIYGGYLHRHRKALESTTWVGALYTYVAYSTATLWIHFSQPIYNTDIKPDTLHIHPKAKRTLLPTLHATTKYAHKIRHKPCMELFHGNTWDVCANMCHIWSPWHQTHDKEHCTQMIPMTTLTWSNW